MSDLFSMRLWLRPYTRSYTQPTPPPLSVSLSLSAIIAINLSLSYSIHQSSQRWVGDRAGEWVRWLNVFKDRPLRLTPPQRPWTVALLVHLWAAAAAAPRAPPPPPPPAMGLLRYRRSYPMLAAALVILLSSSAISLPLSGKRLLLQVMRRMLRSLPLSVFRENEDTFSRNLQPLNQNTLFFSL